MEFSARSRSYRRASGSEEISLLVVEDDDLIRKSLLDWLASVFSDWGLVGTSSREAVRLPTEVAPEVIVVDIALSGEDGPRMVRRIAETFPRAHVVTLTMGAEAEARGALLSAGASACLPIWKLHEELEPIMRELLAGLDPVECGKR